jgi:elongation factor Ts
MRPLYVRGEEVPEGTTEDKSEICLVDQPWVKDSTKTIQVLINERIAKTGENIVVKRFVIYEF